MGKYTLGLKVRDTPTSTHPPEFALTTFTLLVVNPPPVVTSVSPVTGSTAGGTLVTLTGTFLAGPTNVVFGTTPAASSSQEER